MSWGIMIAFAYSSLNLMFYLVTGLYLNGSFFSPIVVPLLVLLVYAWNTWKSCVEMEYWQLKAKIYEVCDEYCEKSTNSSSTTSLSHLVSSYTVNVKEGTVSKALYDRIRENILPYNEVFFNFFVRMCFIGNFCLVVVVMMYFNSSKIQRHRRARVNHEHNCNKHDPVNFRHNFVNSRQPLQPVSSKRNLQVVNKFENM